MPIPHLHTQRAAIHPSASISAKYTKRRKQQITEKEKMRPMVSSRKRTEKTVLYFACRKTRKKKKEKDTHEKSNYYHMYLHTHLSLYLSIYRSNCESEIIPASLCFISLAYLCISLYPCMCMSIHPRQTDSLSGLSSLGKLVIMKRNFDAHSHQKESSRLPRHSSSS